MVADEIWKSIPGYPDYEVSDLGRVRSLKGKTVRFLRYVKDKDGYLRVGVVMANGKSTTRFVHKLVMLAFVGPCPIGLEVCHNDNDKLNNRPGNLRYDTHRENMLDSLGRLSDDQIREIMRQYKSGIAITRLSREYNISRFTIYQFTRKSRGNRLSLAQRRERARMIREEYAQGYKCKELMKKYNVSKYYIYDIILGRRQIGSGGPIKGVDY